VYKVISMMKRNPNVSAEEFKEFYERKHAPAAAKVLVKYCSDYRRNYLSKQFLTIDGTVRELQDPQGPDSFPYDIVNEFWFKDKESMDIVFKGFAARDRKAEVETEDQRYLDLDSIRVLIVEEAVSTFEKETDGI
jgi:EthD domain